MPVTSLSRMPTRVIRVDVFISSPVDVSAEREIVHRVIERLNRSSLRDRYFLVPLRFEDEVPPEIGCEPQRIVDRYMPVQKSHVLIAMFWTRMGTPFTTETGEQFESGTQYELLKGYEQYRQCGRPHILLYRKQKENPEADVGQREKVDAFLRRFMEEKSDLKGLIKQYSETDEFEALVSDHLQKILSTYPPDADDDKLIERPEFQEEERRLDAAMPKQTALGESTEVRAMVCLPDSEGLRARLPVSVEGHEIGKGDVRKGSLAVAFPKDKNTGRLQSTTVTLEIDAADFDSVPPQAVQLTPSRNTGLIVFPLMPLRARKRSLVIVRVKAKALDGTEITCGSTSLQTEITATKIQKLASALWSLVSLPLGAAASPHRQPLDVRESCYRASSASGFAGPEGNPTSADVFEGWQIDEHTWRLRFRFPADQAEFPYSAVLVKLVQDEQVVGTPSLMPVTLEPAGTHYANSIGLEELLGDCSFEKTMRPQFWADAASILKQVSVEEVDRFLETPYVCSRQQVAEALRRLRDDLQGLHKDSDNSANVESEDNEL